MGLYFKICTILKVIKAFCGYKVTQALPSKIINRIYGYVTLEHKHVRGVCHFCSTCGTTHESYSLIQK